MRLATDGGHLDVDFLFEVEVYGRVVFPDGRAAVGVLEVEGPGPHDRVASVLDADGRASVTLTTDGTTRYAFVLRLGGAPHRFEAILPAGSPRVPWTELAE
jgi:hypothetical protein